MVTPLKSDLQITWLPVRPSFVIRVLRGTGHMCYSETTYEVVSARVLNDVAFAHLVDAGLLGVGQGHDVMCHETIVDDVSPVTVDRRTGEVLPFVPPTSDDGQLYTRTYRYIYHRYAVRCVCDSGD